MAAQEKAKKENPPLPRLVALPCIRYLPLPFPFSFLNFINGVFGRLRITLLQGEIHRNW